MPSTQSARQRHGAATVPAHISDDIN
jgi:antitoxin (DNA-binding transcriptional repressor) of toxin-antitoxin stability system